MKYDPRTFTWGFEIEWGDINRKLKIPKHLGKWEHSEFDIVNLYGKYRGQAADPLGINPPVGGEINTVPTKTWQKQVEHIFEIYDFFVRNGDNPSAGCVNHGHIHVHIPGLINDIVSLKKLIKYIQKNQQTTIDHCYQFQELPGVENISPIYVSAKQYFKYDCGFGMPDDMCNNIINLANNFDEFIMLHNPYYRFEKQNIKIESKYESYKSQKDNFLNRLGTPINPRYAINTLSLKYNKTIEFRCFRSSINRKEVSDSFKFVENFLDCALNDGPDVEEILQRYDYTFPEFNYDFEMFTQWSKTVYNYSRMRKKQRKFYEIDQIED